ncbi:hypothetical protein SMD44_08242 [Streptomyces alboflavus]|uniref:Uncharacterized protein n=1 Tax=Streptomyces alboflavus TaxID=67267 RepID=A0A1Z1WQP0_9ACTN|nr:hypothetical protein [Streptomyces alboflavus]ARX88755.1 hypothetical protein SMD44_08242 [Streptomyces alboflavus]
MTARSSKARVSPSTRTTVAGVGPVPSAPRAAMSAGWEVAARYEVSARWEGPVTDR